jgi:formylglycine-generating enzyme required for sulfatase activity
VYGPGLAGFDGVEKSIRGGSWVNSEREIAFWTRASQPPQWCSPFTGFRVVLAPRE